MLRNRARWKFWIELDTLGGLLLQLTNSMPTFLKLRNIDRDCGLQRDRLIVSGYFSNIYTNFQSNLNGYQYGNVKRPRIKDDENHFRYKE